MDEKEHAVDVMTNLTAWNQCMDCHFIKFDTVMLRTLISSCANFVVLVKSTSWEVNFSHSSRWGWWSSSTFVLIYNMSWLYIVQVCLRKELGKHTTSNRQQWVLPIETASVGFPFTKSYYGVEFCLPNNELTGPIARRSERAQWAVRCIQLHFATSAVLRIRHSWVVIWRRLFLAVELTSLCKQIFVSIFFSFFFFFSFLIWSVKI